MPYTGMYYVMPFKKKEKKYVGKIRRSKHQICAFVMSLIYTQNAHLKGFKNIFSILF